MTSKLFVFLLKKCFNVPLNPGSLDDTSKDFVKFLRTKGYDSWSSEKKRAASNTFQKLKDTTLKYIHLKIKEI